MALNTSGPISLGGSTTGESIAVELGQSPAGTISLNDTNVRSLAAVPSGQIIIPGNFYGKSVAFVFNQTIASDTSDYNVRNAAIAAGWNQTTILLATITVNSGVTVRSTQNNGAAFYTGGSYPYGTVISLVNNGLIVGKGGSGGTGGTGTNTTSSIRNGNPGGNGGTAIQMNYWLTLTNNNIIAGGGGGGGGGGSAVYFFDSITYQLVGGSGGGGGAGNGPAGAGGSTTAGAATRNGNNGSAGTDTAGGAGGPITNPGGSWFARGGAGGNGGGWGAAGSAGSSPPPGFTAIGSSGGAGGAAGKAIDLSIYSITYINVGQIYGAVS